MTLLLFARHGETDWNREGRWQGHADPGLNERGRDQARELAQQLADTAIDAIYASDLKRAHETALIVAERKRMQVTVDAGLREMDVGSWSGLTKAEIQSRFPTAQWHDGESDERHLARVLASTTRIANAHRGQRVLIVSHGGSLRTLRRHAIGAPAPILGNCETYRLYFDGQQFAAELSGQPLP